MIVAERKDVTAKTLMQYPDVFARLVNTFVWDSHCHVLPENLEPAPTSSAVVFPGDDSLHEQLRDVAMFEKWDGVVYNLYAFENQVSQIDYMPLRVIAYDGAAYKEQASMRDRGVRAPLYPVITLVLNFSGRPWVAPTSLHSCLGIRPESPLSCLVSDYQIKVVNLQSYSGGEWSDVLGEFHSVCQALDRKRCGNIELRDIQHPDELGRLLAALLGDDKVQEIVSTVYVGGTASMVEWIAEARAKERALGRQEALNEVIAQLMKNTGKTREQVLEMLRGPAQPSGVGKMKL